MYVMGFHNWLRSRGYTTSMLNRMSKQTRNNERKAYIRQYLGGFVAEGAVSPERAADLSGLAHPGEVAAELAR